MAVKLFLDNILLLKFYRFEEFSNQHKNVGMDIMLRLEALDAIWLFGEYRSRQLNLEHACIK